MLFYLECVPLTISYHTGFLCISKVSTMLHHGSTRGAQSRSQISGSKKWAKRAKKPACRQKFFYNLIAILTFCDSFKLVQRDFCGESITFLEITLVPNSLNNVNDILRKYSDILRTLCNPSIFKTLVYLKPWHIQNQRHMQKAGTFRTKIYSEP